MAVPVVGRRAMLPLVERVASIWLRCGASALRRHACIGSASHNTRSFGAIRDKWPVVSARGRTTRRPASGVVPPAACDRARDGPEAAEYEPLSPPDGECGERGIQRLFHDLVLTVSVKEKCPHSYQLHRIADRSSRSRCRCSLHRRRVLTVSHVCVACGVRRVETADDLTVLMDALLLCGFANSKFDLHGTGSTTAKLVAACARVHDPATAFHLLQEATQYGLLPAARTYAKVAACAAENNAPEVAVAASRLLFSRGLRASPKVLHQLIKCVPPVPPPPLPRTNTALLLFPITECVSCTPTPAPQM